MSEMASVCPKCNQYYPYDCYLEGCKDEHCDCDGCMTMKSIEGDEE